MNLGFKVLNVIPLAAVEFVAILERSAPTSTLTDQLTAQHYNEWCSPESFVGKMALKDGTGSGYIFPRKSSQ